MDNENEESIDSETFDEEISEETDDYEINWLGTKEDLLRYL